MAALIKIRRDTSANWASNDPQLAQGELGLDTDTGVIKVGNGSDVWSDLLSIGVYNSNDRISKTVDTDTGSLIVDEFGKLYFDRGGTITFDDTGNLFAGTGNSNFKISLDDHTGDVTEYNFGHDGNLTLPAGATIGDLYGDSSTTLSAAPGSDVYIANNNGQQWIGPEGDGVYIGTDYTGNNHQWNFNTNGSLLLPDDGVIGDWYGFTTLSNTAGAAIATSPGNAVVVNPTDGTWIYADNKEYIFGANATVQLPGNIQLDSSSVIKGAASSTGAEKYIEAIDFSVTDHTVIMITSHGFVNSDKIYINNIGPGSTEELTDTYCYVMVIDPDNFEIYSDKELTMPIWADNYTTFVYSGEQPLNGTVVRIYDAGSVNISTTIPEANHDAGQINLNVSDKTWSLHADGNLVLPANGYILNSDMTVYGGTGGAGGGISITDFGEGFSLTASNKVVTNKLYSTNLTEPTQHYRLEVDTNGVVVLPDQSIINGSVLRGVYGTGEANYTGITIGPDADHREESWVWVDHTGVSIATEYSTSAHTWKFDNDGKLTFPGAAGFQATFGSVEPVGDVLHSVNSLYLESEATVGLTSGADVADLESTYIVEEALFTEIRDQDEQSGSGGSRPRPWAGLPSYEAYDLIMAYNPGVGIPLPGNLVTAAYSAKIAYYIWQTARTNAGVQINVADKQWTFGTNGNLTLPTGGKIHSAAGGNVEVNTNDGANSYSWIFGTDGSLTYPDNTIQNTAFTDIAAHVFFVHPDPGYAYTPTGTINSPFNTIGDAIDAAVAAGHDDTDCASVILLASITENVTLKPGIFLTSLGTGTHGSPNITGNITITSSTGTTVTNHYSISNLRIVAPTNGKCINFTGSAPQKLFIRDMWLDANGTGACVYMDNVGTGSTVQFDVGHLAHSGSGDVYCINVVNGGCYVTELETTGAVQVAAVQDGAILTIDRSELDANGDAVIEAYGTGNITITNSSINNIKADSSGISLIDAGGTATIGNCLFNIPAGAGYSVKGYTGSHLYAANNVFITANLYRSTGITYAALPTTWLTKA